MEVIIIGGLHHNTLGVVRSIGERIPKNKIHVLIVSDNPERRNLISESKYVAKDQLYYIKKYENIVPWLVNFAKDKLKRVIISCADGVTLQIIEYKKELDDYYLMPDTKVDIVNLMSKEIQAEYAVQSGLLVPKGVILWKNQSTSWNSFPCIIKPLKSTIGAGKADIRIVKSDKELKEILLTIEAECIQIQEYIKKKMEYQLIGCSINAGEKIIIPGYTDIIRQPENTNTGYLKYSPISDFSYDRYAVEKFIRSIGYSGLFSVEFIRTDNGEDYFLEINMRNDGNAYCVKSAGVNLPYIWYYYESNGELPIGEPVSIDKSVMFIPDLNDFMRGIKSVGLFGWIKQFLKSESHSVWNTQDMGPFWVQVKIFAIIAIKRILRI